MKPMKRPRKAPSKQRVPRERIRNGVTYHSVRFPGEGGNHHTVVCCDVTDGFVGIEAPLDFERVLLSPAQWRAVVAFVNDHTAR